MQRTTVSTTRSYPSHLFYLHNAVYPINYKIRSMHEQAAEHMLEDNNAASEDATHIYIPSYRERLRQARSLDLRM